MHYVKITDGSVYQTFDSDGLCTKQEFVAGDDVRYYTEEGTEIDVEDMPFGGDEYYPFSMVQPSEFDTPE